MLEFDLPSLRVNSGKMFVAFFYPIYFALKLIIVLID